MKESSIKPLTLDKLPNLFAQQERIILSDVNLLINDIGIDLNQQQAIQSFVSARLEFLNPAELSFLLKQQLKNSLSFPPEKKLAVLFPLQGGATVQKTLDFENIFNNLSELQQFTVESVRSQPNSLPFVTLPEELIFKLKNRQFDTVLIVDDVIVTGSTMEKIKTQVYQETDQIDYSRYEESLRFSYGEISRTRLPIDWYAAAWMTYSKPQSQLSSFTAFQKIFSGIYYKGEKGQTPLNSLSTWIYDQRKGQKVLNNYAQKYTIDPTGFTNYINSLCL